MGRTGRILMSAVMLAMAATACTATGQATDPVIGTWVLNVAKSKYEGPATKSQTRTYAAAPNGYKFSADAVSAAGEKGHSEFTAVFDGRFHAFTGSSIADSIMVKRVDANTVETIQKQGATMVTFATRTISADGKTLTNTSRGISAEGRPYTNVEVFDKK